MQRFFLWVAVGAFVGQLLAALIAPSALETLLASTGASDAMCQCTELVRRTANKLLMTQLTGAIIGAVAGPVLAWFVKRFFKKRSGGGAATAASGE